MREIELMKTIQLGLSRLGLKIWRNNVGQVKTEDGRYIQFGLCEGSSDLIGYTPTVVTDAMVGKTVAVFTAIEVKTERGKLTIDQSNFIAVVKRDGGIAMCARSYDEAAQMVFNGVL